MKFKTKIFIALSAIMLLFLIPLLLNIMFKLDAGLWFLQSEWSAGEALGFYGATLSGVLTVLGVLLTIRHEKNESRKDDSIKYKPILEVCGVDLPVTCGHREVGLGYSVGFSHASPNQKELEEKYLDSQLDSKPKYTLYFKNVGRGETFNAYIDNFEVNNMNWDDITDIYPNHSTHQYIGEIIKDGYLSVGVKLPDYLVLPKELDGHKWFELSTKLYINYSDMFNRVKYQYIVYLSHKIIIENIESDSFDFYNENYHCVKVKYELYQIMPQKMIFSKEKGEFVHENKFIPE